MNILSKEKRAQIVAHLVEGNSLRGTSRIMDISYNTILRYLPKVGAACADYQDKVFRNLNCKYIQIDEIWSFVHTRGINVPQNRKDFWGHGSWWTFVAIDADSRLVPCWRNGPRNYETAFNFLYRLRERINGKPQITSDGFSAYKDAMEETFGTEIDYGMLIKIFDKGKTDPQTLKLFEKPGIRAVKITGSPDPKRMTTSYVERQNLTMRQGMKRFARKTNAHSKKVENHGWAIALHFFYYNFCRIHTTLRVTPAMQAGISDRVWSIKDIVDLAENKMIPK